jgi:hypothetical protein
VHEHEISKRVFVFPKRNKIYELLDPEQDGADGQQQTATPLDQLTLDDFEEVEFRADRLGYYTEQAAVTRIMLKRCWANAKNELKRITASDDPMERRKITAVKTTVGYSR